jgi:hypothetical protein
MFREVGIQKLIRVRRGRTTMIWSCKRNESNKDIRKGIKIDI